MNALSAILCVVVTLALLLAANESPLPRDPLEMLALLGGGLFVALGFVLFGQRRFDEPPGERRHQDASRR